MNLISCHLIHVSLFHHLNEKFKSGCGERLPSSGELYEKIVENHPNFNDIHSYNALPSGSFEAVMLLVAEKHILMKRYVLLN